MMEWLSLTLLASGAEQMRKGYQPLSVVEENVAHGQAHGRHLKEPDPVGTARSSRAVVTCIGIVTALQATVDVSGEMEKRKQRWKTGMFKLMKSS